MQFLEFALNLQNSRTLSLKKNMYKHPMLLALVLAGILFILLGWASLTFKYLYSYIHNENAWSKIRNKWVIVTNASSEIGQSLCKRLAYRGCRLILLGPNEEELMELKGALSKAVEVVVYQVDYGTKNDYSFLSKYDIGLLINKIGFYTSEPTKFIEYRPDYLIDHYIRGPMQIIRAVMTQMTENKVGYVINIGFTFTEKPRPYYSMVTGFKALFRTWSESMYYEMKDYKINVEYMESGMIATKNRVFPSFFCPTPDTFAENVLNTFGNSFFTVPYFPHFISYLGITMIPKFLVARYRKHNICSFAKTVNGLR